MAEVPDVAQAYQLARNALDERPSRMVLAEQLVTVYQTYLQTTPRRMWRQPHRRRPIEQGAGMTRCTQPGCTGTIVDGYCDVCGSPGPVSTG